MSALFMGTYLMMAFGPAQTAKSWTLNADNNNGVATIEFRNNVQSLLAGGTQIRCTFNASATGSLVCTHASIGITATAPSAVATPVELTFAGVSGFSLTSGQSITSDWIDFVTTVGGNIMVISDYTTSNARQLGSASGTEWYFKSASTEWNVASVTGFTDGGAVASIVNLVEVR